MTAAVRIAEEDGAREYRPKLDHQIINWSPEDTINSDGTTSKSNTQFWVMLHIILAQILLHLHKL